MTEWLLGVISALAAMFLFSYVNKDKEIKKVMIDNKSIAYESSKDSHDHFICNDCGTIESIHIPRKSIKGRKVDDVTVRGSCNKCAD